MEEGWNLGLRRKTFPKTVDYYFVKFEDICSTQTHKCNGRVMGVLMDMRIRAKYDSRCTNDLVEMYKDAHILDSGSRKAGPGEWQCGSD